MTTYARIITIGKNSQMPRTYTLPIGVGVDGTVFTTRITLQPDEILCPECKGQGEFTYTPINPSERDYTVKCEHCNGNGIIEIEED